MKEKNLKQGVSLLVLDNEEKVVAIRISTIFDRKDSLTEHKTVQASSYSSFIGTVLGSVGSPGELLEKEGDIERVFCLDIMTVQSAHRGRGIASQLIQCSIEVSWGRSLTDLTHKAKEGVK